MPEVKTTLINLKKTYIRISRTKFSSTVENYRESKRVVKITQPVNHARGQNNYVILKKLYTYFEI